MRKIFLVLAVLSAHSASAGYVFDCEDVLTGHNFPMLAGGTPFAGGPAPSIAGTYPTGPSVLTASSSVPATRSNATLNSGKDVYGEVAVPDRPVDLTMEDVSDLLVRSGVRTPSYEHASDRARAEARGFDGIFRVQPTSIFGRRAKLQIADDSGMNSWLLATVHSRIEPDGVSRNRTHILITVDCRSEYTNPTDSEPLWTKDIPIQQFTSIKGVLPGVTPIKPRELINVMVRSMASSYHLNIQNVPDLLGKRMQFEGTLKDGTEMVSSGVLVGAWWDGTQYILMVSAGHRLLEFTKAELKSPSQSSYRDF